MEEVKKQIVLMIGYCEFENEQYQSALNRDQMGAVSEEITRTMIRMNEKTIKYLRIILDKLPTEQPVPDPGRDSWPG